MERPRAPAVPLPLTVDSGRLEARATAAATNLLFACPRPVHTFHPPSYVTFLGNTSGHEALRLKPGAAKLQGEKCLMTAWMAGTTLFSLCPDGTVCEIVLPSGWILMESSWNILPSLLPSNMWHLKRTFWQIVVQIHTPICFLWDDLSLLPF